MQSVDQTARRVIAGKSIRWDETQAKSAYEQGYWVETTLADKLQQAAAETPERVLIIDGAIRLDAQTFYEKASRLAQVMAARYPQGSVISFMLPNWHETAIIYMAATMAGMIAHPILPSLREHDLGFMLKDVASKMIFIPQTFRKHQYADMLATVIGKLEQPPEVVVVRGDNHQHTAYDSLFTEAPDSEAPPIAATQALPKVDANSVRMIMYTSGTTGNPKGVMHTHNSIHALITQIGEHWLVEPGDKFLVASPISHIGGSIYAFECPLLLGATAVLMEHWNADQAIELLEAEGCTHFAGATPFLVQTLASAKHANTRLPSLKLFVCGGASVPPSLIFEAKEYFQRADVTRVYGSTEVPVMTVGVVGDVNHAANTDGQPGIAHIKIATGQNKENSGEVLAKGPQMLVGYLHSEDEDGAFDEQGYFRTGDLGQWVDDNYLVIVGRAKDIIIRHGENIAPKEVEDLLINHPAINEIAIVGLPDPKTGEKACAVIVANADSQPTVEDLAEFLITKGLAKFKIPEQVLLWKQLPKNDAGKILKHKIRSTILES
ncbi:MAG: AMP-binding protein [Pseudomonadales bacterium]|nr:AMP-binding protein [Pseudomonadales bacterium]